MKKKVIIIGLVGLCLVFNTNALQIGDLVKKEIYVMDKNMTLQMTFNSITEYNKKGEMILRESYNEFKQYEYDKYGNVIRESLTELRDEITEYEYDLKRNITYKKSYVYDKETRTVKNTIEQFYKYDSKGNKISWQMDNYIPTRYQYDTAGHLIFEDDPWNGGVKTYYEYDQYGDNTHERKIFSNGNIIDYWYKYDSLGHMTYSEGSDGTVYIWEYDAVGNKTHQKFKYNGAWNESWYGYDADIIWEFWKPANSNNNYVTWYEYVYKADGSKIQYEYKGQTK